MNKIFTQKKHAEVNLKSADDVIIPLSFNFEPSKNSINNILNYSKALSVKKSTLLNHLEIVLN